MHECMYHQYFAALLSDRVDHILVYIDGSFVQGLTCNAFIYYSQVFSYCLHSSNRVFSAKLPCTELSCSFDTSDRTVVSFARIV
jgi:hypothetical protein